MDSVTLQTQFAVFQEGIVPKKFHGGPSTSKDETGLHHTESTQGEGSSRAVMADEEEREEAFILSQSSKKNKGLLDYCM